MRKHNLGVTLPTLALIFGGCFKRGSDSNVQVAGAKEITERALKSPLKDPRQALVETQILASAVSVQDDDGEQYCSGVLIGENQVLTAAHCIWWSEQGQGRIKVGHGEKGKTRRPVTTKLMHEAAVQRQDIYRLNTPSNDLAILILGGKAFEKAKPIKIASAKLSLPAGRQQKFWVAGYGPTFTRTGLLDWLHEYDNGKLRYSEMMISKETATSLRFETFTRDTSACQGDSGGPAYFEMENTLYVAGLVLGAHGGVKCDGGLLTNVFTDLRHYTKWIEDNAGIDISTGAPKPQNITATVVK